MHQKPLICIIAKWLNKGMNGGVIRQGFKQEISAELEVEATGSTHDECILGQTP